MKKYVVPVIECVELKLSECIALCDGSCPSDGYYNQNGEKVWLTALTTSMGG